MADTSKEISIKQLEIYLSKSESERFRISDELILFGRKVLESTILQDHPGISVIDLKIEVFKRCYRDFYSNDELSRIIISIRHFLSLEVEEC
jgi:hypothetical protein